MYTPMKSAIGIVAATVEVPHGLPNIAFTTTRPSTPIRMIMIASTPTSAATPPTGPISSRTIWPRLLPFRRSEPTRIVKSCTAPPSTTPIRM